MKISIITAVLNAAETIEACMRSVRAQTYPDVEHIIVDGGSTDGTLEVIKTGYRCEVIGDGNKHDNEDGDRQTVTYDLLPNTHDLIRVSRLISEPDRGIYDALNKGILSATGDVIGFLHADDVYADEGVLERVAEVMGQGNCDSCYGDLVYVKETGNRERQVIGDETNKDEKAGNGNFRIVRYWRAGPYDRALFRKGWMPPHPTFFAKRELYGRLGGFDTSFGISADYELMLRFLWQKGISACYIPEVLVRMRIGGVSNRGVGNIVLKSSEDYRAMRMHGVGGVATLVRKNISKIPQFFQKKG